MAFPDRLLLICLAIDAIGLLNVLWGEALDAIWAPVSAVLLRYLFPEQLLFSVLQFVEEMLPLTDFVPTATLAYYYTRWQNGTAGRRQRGQQR